jgi:hypothetical protein
VGLFPFGIAKMGGVFGNAKRTAAFVASFFHFQRRRTGNKFIFKQRKFSLSEDFFSRESPDG